MPRQAGLGKAHRHDTVEDLPATLTPHAPPPETVARDRVAMWLETAMFLRRYKWATSANKAVPR